MDYKTQAKNAAGMNGVVSIENFFNLTAKLYIIIAFQIFIYPLHIKSMINPLNNSVVSGTTNCTCILHLLRIR